MYRLELDNKNYINVFLPNACKYFLNLNEYILISSNIILVEE